MTDFASRRAIVTGGVHGIGASIVRRLRSAGAEAVVLDLDRSAAGAPTLLVDLANTGALRGTVNRAIAQLGGCDVLVNCAGILVLSPLVFSNLEPEDYHHVLAVNLHAPVFMMKEVGRHMVQAEYGRIVDGTSVHGRLSEPRASRVRCVESRARGRHPHGFPRACSFRCAGQRRSTRVRKDADVGC